MSSPLAIALELTRIVEPDDPHAFRFEPQGYTLRGPTGGVERFDVPWSPALLADLDALRRPRCDPASIQRVGDLLQRALRPIGWTGLGEQILGASAAGRPVVVTLRSNAAELYALPWELVTLGASGRHLGELPGVLLRHEWPATTSCPELPSPRPEGGRLLLAWSAAGGAVPAAEHQRALATACSEGHVGFDPATDALPHASLARLTAILAAAEAAGEPFTALHLLAHGGQAGTTFGLVLDGEDDRPIVVDAGRLRQLLAPHAGALRLIVLAACDGGNVGTPGNHLGSVAQALHRAGIQSVVASRFPLTVAGSVVLAETLYRALLVDLDPLERALTRTRTRLASAVEGLDWASLQLYAREGDGDDTRPVLFCPYRGLLAFEARHRRFFFGRDAERREALGDLQALIDGDRPRFLVVVGASGTGKSSMVLAGVVPDIARLVARRQGAWEVVRMVPGTAPGAALQDILDRRGEQPLLLVVDQFEELFTHTSDPAARTAFVRRLWSLSSADTGVHVVVTLRVDFLGHCGELVVDDGGLSLDRVAYDESHRVFVARMSPDQVRAAIEAPAARVGLTFSPGLLERILADVGAEPGALPLLQYALGRLWQRRRGHTLAADVYEDLGGLVGALEKDADDLIRGLDGEQQRHARRLLTRLVDTREDETVDTRRRVEVPALQPAAADRRATFDAILTRLVDARLVVRSGEGAAPTLEIAHEALIRRWGILRAWIGEDRVMLVELEKLRAWARDWGENRTLLAGTRLDRACEFVRQHPEDIDESVRGLVAASEAERRRLAASEEAQRRRRRNTVSAVIAVLTTAVLGTSGVSVYALRQRAEAVEAKKSADDEKERAETEKERAEAAERSSQAERDRARDAVWMAYARKHAASDPTRAALGLANVAANDAPGWRQDTLRALARPIATVVLPAKIASFSHDGGRILAATDDAVRVWNADGSGVPLVLADIFSDVVSADFSGDDRRVLVVDAETVRVLNADGSGAPFVLDLASDRAKEWMGFSRDGRRLLTPGPVNTLRVWNTADFGEPLVLRGHQHDVAEALLSPDGRHVSSVSVDGTMRVWKTDAPLDPVVLPGDLRNPEFSLDGRRILAIDDATRVVRVWNADGSGRPVALRGHTSFVDEAHFSPDGRRVLTADEKVARVWNADGSGQPIVLDNHEAEVGWVSFTPDSANVVIADVLGVTVWSADTPELIRHLDICESAVVPVGFSRDGRLLLTLAETGACAVRIDGDGEPVFFASSVSGANPASFSPDGRRVLTNDGAMARVWSTAPDEPRVLDEEVRSAAFSADGGRIVTISTRGSGRVWNADGAGEPLVLRHEDLHESASFSPNGRRIVTTSHEHGVQVWSADESGEPLVLRGNADGIGPASFSPDGRHIVLASPDDDTAAIWSTERPGGPLVLRGHKGKVTSASFSPDGRRIVTTSWDDTARIWRADGSGEPVVLRGHKTLVTSASFSPDGQRIVTASWDHTAQVWNADGSGEQVILFGHQDNVESATFSPDGGRVVTTSSDKTARVWHADGSGEPVVLVGHEGTVESAQFSVDGLRVVTTSQDDTVRVWNADGSGEPLVLPGRRGVGSAPASFSRDGQRVLLVADKTAQIWPTEPTLLRTRLAAATTFCIPPEERVSDIGEPRDVACEAFAECESLHGRSGECSLPDARAAGPAGRLTANANHAAIEEHLWRGDQATTPEQARVNLLQALAVAEAWVQAEPASKMARSDLAVTLERLATVEAQADDFVRARDYFTRSLALYEALSANDPTDTDAQHALYSILNQRGEMEARADDPVDARGYFERALVLGTALIAAGSNRAATQRELSALHTRLGHAEAKEGNLHAARDHFERSLALIESLAVPNFRTRNDRLDAIEDLAGLEMQAGNLAVARRHYERALAAAETMDHDDPSALFFVISPLERLGALEAEAGDFVAARRHCERVISLGEAEAARDPERRRRLPGYLVDLGDVEVAAGDLVAARRHFDKALAIAEALSAAGPPSTANERLIVLARIKLGETAVQAADLAAARGHFERALAILEARSDESAANRYERLRVRLRLGDLETGAKDHAAAHGHYAGALADAEATGDPRDLLVPLTRLGDLAVQADDLAAARGHFERAVSITETAATADPSSTRARRDQASALVDLGDVEVKADDLAAARGHFERAVSLREALAAADPSSARARRELAVSLDRLANAARKDGDLAAARAATERELEIDDALAAADPTDADAQRHLSFTLNNLGTLELKAEKFAAARTAFERSLKIRQALAAADRTDVEARLAVVRSLLLLGELPDEPKNPGRAKHLRAAKAILDAMHAKKQIAGVEARERLRDRVEAALAEFPR